MQWQIILGNGALSIWKHSNERDILFFSSYWNKYLSFIRREPQQENSKESRGMKAQRSLERRMGAQ